MCRETVAPEAKPFRGSGPPTLRSVAGLLATVVLPLLLPAAVTAQTLWTLNGDGDWFDAAHWSAGVPHASVVARIDLGTVRLDAPGAAASSVQIGQTADSTGRLEVQGGGTLSGTHLLVAAGTGADSLLLIQGGSLSFNPSDSSNVWLGASGRGEVRILDGGVLRTRNSSIGRFGAADGVVAVEGNGSRWENAGQLYVGHFGRGSLAVRQGGEVVASDITLGFGASATGSLTVASGGMLETGRLARGSGAGGVTFDGGILRVAENPPDASAFTSGLGNGEFELQTGGLTFDSNGQSVTVAAPLSGAGGLVKTGSGTLTLTGANTYTGATAVEGGVLRIASEGHMPGSSTYVADGGTLDLRGVNSFAFSEMTIRNGGKVLSEPQGFNPLGGAPASVVVSGPGSAWTINSAARYYFGSGEMLIEAGGKVSFTQGLEMANLAGSAVSVVIRGTGSELRTGGDFFLPRGVGDTRIEDGGSLFSTVGILGYNGGGSGTIVVSGSGSQWDNQHFMQIGVSGKGWMRIENGGLVRSTESFVAAGSGGSGKVEVIGLGSRWQADSQLSVGYFGSGELLVREGGRVSALSAVVGYSGAAANGTVEVSGAGSLWEIGTTLTVGQASAGNLVIANGGLVTMQSGVLGQDAGSTGAVTVTGSGSEWRSSLATTVGVSGAGQMIVADGGRVTSATGAVGATGQATITGEGSIWETAADFSTAGTVTATSGGTLDVSGLLRAEGAGALALRAGGVVQAVELALGAGSLDWTGGELRVTGVGGFTFDAGSLLNPAVGAGQTLDVTHRLTLSGDDPLVLAGGTLRAAEFAFDGSTLDWRSGEVHVTGANGLNTATDAFFRNTILGAGKTLDVTHRLTVSNGDLLALAGGTLRAEELALDGSTVVVSSGALDMDGVGLLSGSGAVLGRVEGGASSAIQAAGTLMLGNAGVAGAVQFEGTLATSGHQVLLLSATQTRLGHTTTLEEGARLTAPNGLLLAEGSTLSTTGSARIDGDFENQGLVSGPSGTGKTLAFSDNVTGGGDFSGNVTFLLEYAPGNSPDRILFDGDLQFASSATLQMEIGGPLSGLEYDALAISGDLLAAGTLQVSLINDYQPLDGSSFQLFTWDTQSSWFSTVLLPELSGGLEWDASQLSSFGVLAIVPEPSAGILFLLGAGAFFFRRRREPPAPMGTQRAS